jgi:hypothetical protein
MLKKLFDLIQGQGSSQSSNKPHYQLPMETMEQLDALETKLDDKDEYFALVISFLIISIEIFSVTNTI